MKLQRLFVWLEHERNLPKMDGNCGTGAAVEVERTKWNCGSGKRKVKEYRVSWFKHLKSPLVGLVLYVARFIGVLAREGGLVSNRSNFLNDKLFLIKIHPLTPRAKATSR